MRTSTSPHEHPRHAHRASTVRYLKLGGTRSSAVPTRLASCRRGSTARQRPTSAPASPRTAPEAALAALATAWLPRVTPELVRETSKPLRRNLRAQNLQAPRKSKICGHKNLRVRKICRSSDVVSTRAKSAGGKICPGSGFGNIYGASVLKLCVAFCEGRRGRPRTSTEGGHHVEPNVVLHQRLGVSIVVVIFIPSWREVDVRLR